ncbi:hypothetical protein MUK42_36698, partial [Musa troglodytarum]
MESSLSTRPMRSSTMSTRTNDDCARNSRSTVRFGQVRHEDLCQVSPLHSSRVQDGRSSLMCSAAVGSGIRLQKEGKEGKKSEEFGCSLYPCHWVDLTYTTDKEDSMRKVGSRNRLSDGRIK